MTYRIVRTERGRHGRCREAADRISGITADEALSAFMGEVDAIRFGPAARRPQSIRLEGWSGGLRSVLAEERFDGAAAPVLREDARCGR